MAKAFCFLEGIPGKKRGVGTLVRMTKERLSLADDVWAIPASML